MHSLVPTIPGNRLGCSNHHFANCPGVYTSFAFVMSVFKDFGFDLDANNFDALLEQRASAHSAITKDKLEQSSTQKKRNVKAIADAEGISVTALKKKLKAERAAKALAEQKDKERQDRKLKNKQERKDNLRAAAEAEGMPIAGYKKQLIGEKAARALADEEAMKGKEFTSV